MLKVRKFIKLNLVGGQVSNLGVVSKHSRGGGHVGWLCPTSGRAANSGTHQPGVPREGGSCLSFVSLPIFELERRQEEPEGGASAKEGYSRGNIRMPPL